MKRLIPCKLPGRSGHQGRAPTSSELLRQPWGSEALSARVPKLQAQRAGPNPLNYLELAQHPKEPSSGAVVQPLSAGLWQPSLQPVTVPEKQPGSQKWSGLLWPEAISPDPCCLEQEWGSPGCPS